MQHVVSQLIEKKRELQGEVNSYKGRIDVLTKVINSIDVSIQVFKPDFDPTTIKAKKFSINSRYFENGEPFKKILDLLREKNDYLSTHDITVELMKSKKYDYTDRALKNKIQKSLLQTLRNQLNKGLIVNHKQSDKILVWKIAD